MASGGLDRRDWYFCGLQKDWVHIWIRRSVGDRGLGFGVRGKAGLEVRRGMVTVRCLLPWNEVAIERIVYSRERYFL